MYYFLLSLHSLVRWLVLFSVLLSLYTAYTGLFRKSKFTSGANSLRHWTATISHIQMMIGITIYFQSPVVKYGATSGNEGFFFRYVHISFMILAVVLITIGSAKAKRMSTDFEKYRTMSGWFTAALVIIALAIPWPVYEFVSRPLVRWF